MKLFYDHLIIQINDVYTEIERLEITTKEKKTLKDLIEDTTHHTVIDTILSHLKKSHHQKFLRRFHQSPHDPSHLSFLKEQIGDIEDQIQAAAAKLKTTFLSELADQLDQS